MGVGVIKFYSPQVASGDKGALTPLTKIRRTLVPVGALLGDTLGLSIYRSTIGILNVINVILL